MFTQLLGFQLISDELKCMICDKINIFIITINHSAMNCFFFFLKIYSLILYIPGIVFQPSTPSRTLPLTPFTPDPHILCFPSETIRHSRISSKLHITRQGTQPIIPQVNEVIQWENIRDNPHSYCQESHKTAKLYNHSIRKGDPLRFFDCLFSLCGINLIDPVGHVFIGSSTPLETTIIPPHISQSFPSSA